ncbi:MAG: hypothetical protein HKP12_03985 [Gammaproteobacteria bacterium]|nr:hypothetical protein [Gammaproteobacteria bacterium]
MDRKRQKNSSNIATGLVVLVLSLLNGILLGVAKPALADSSRHVVIVTSSDSSYQQRTASRIQQNIDSTETQALIISSDELTTSPKHSNTVYVTIGERAITKLHDYASEAIVLRINNRNIQRTNYTSAQSDLITEQPACKHLQLIRALNPRWTTIGVLSSINSAEATAELTICAIKYNLNLQLYAITDESDLLTTLETAVENNQVLLAIVDPLIYNSRTVKNILLTSYRHRKPVIGYSDSFVQAGAIAAVYTSPETAGDDAANILSDFFANNWQFNHTVHTPSGFEVSTNARVAASLDLALPDQRTIIRRIQNMEIKP